MSIRWPRFLPRLPALLLIPAVLGLCVALCAAPRKYPGGAWYFSPRSGTVRWAEPRGFPFVFDGGKNERMLDAKLIVGCGFRTAPFLADLALALATAYLLQWQSSDCCSRWLVGYLGRKRNGASQTEPWPLERLIPE